MSILFARDDELIILPHTVYVDYNPFEMGGISQHLGEIEVL